MELLIIIVQELDFPRLSSAFIHNHVLATKFCTEGLYLNKRNITLMVCIPKEREEERLVSEFNGMTMVDVTKGVKVGGATVFFIDIDRMQKF